MAYLLLHLPQRGVWLFTLINDQIPQNTPMLPERSAGVNNTRQLVLLGTLVE